MSAMHVGIGLLLIAAGAVPVGARDLDQPQTGPPTTAAAEVTPCAQAQMVVDQLLATAMARMDMARQANAAADLRAAVDSVQTTVRDARAQLAACASMPPATGAQGGHTMPGRIQMPAPGTPVPSAKPPAAPMDHSKMNMGTPAKPAPGAKPAAGVKPPSAPMDHSKMEMGTAAKPATGAKPASGTKPPAAPAPKDHSKMNMGTPGKPAPAKGAKPDAPAAMDHSKMAMSAPPADTSAQATDPVCGLKVDPATAPQAGHQGQTYYFCSEQHRQLFQKAPAKYLPKGK